MSRGGCELAQCTVSVVAQKACIIADSGKLMNSEPCVLSGVGEMSEVEPPTAYALEITRRGKNTPDARPGSRASSLPFPQLFISLQED